MYVMGELTEDEIFQSTHPSGVRRDLVAVVTIDAQISIHAPQWGATADTTRPATVNVFQSTHPSGVRPCTSPISVAAHSFQSTHPSGVRPTIIS